MLITPAQFRAQSADVRHKRLNCFVGNPGAGRISTAMMCNGFWLILNVTTAPRREGEAPQIDLADFMSLLYEGVPLIRIPRKKTGLQLPERIHASPEEFGSLYRSGQLLWTIISEEGHQEGALEELIQMGLHSETHPSIICVSLETAVWLATEYEYASDQVNCFLFELSPFERQENADLDQKLKEQADESPVPFIVIPWIHAPWAKATFIKETVKSGSQRRIPK